MWPGQGCIRPRSSCAPDGGLGRSAVSPKFNEFSQLGISDKINVACFRAVFCFFVTLYLSVTRGSKLDKFAENGKSL